MLRIGRYEVIEEIGRGAAASVYRARDPRLDRTVALEWFARSSAPGGGGEDADHRERRAVREARIAASLSHPCIVAVHDVERVEESDGGLLIAMEDLLGETVEQRIQRQGPLPVPEAVSIVRQAARGPAHAHARGIVHRDVKPSNLIQDGEGRIKLADFGIARGADSDLTREGTIVGTPHYLSPEQARGGSVDERSDLSALGAVLYYLPTGERPFAGETAAETLSRIPLGASHLSLLFEPEGGGPSRAGSLRLKGEGDEPGAVVVGGWRQRRELTLRWRGLPDSPRSSSSR